MRSVLVLSILGVCLVGCSGDAKPAENSAAVTDNATQKAKPTGMTPNFNPDIDPNRMGSQTK